MPVTKEQFLNSDTNKVFLMFLICKTKTRIESMWICSSHIKHHKKVKTFQGPDHTDNSSGLADVYEQNDVFARLYFFSSSFTLYAVYAEKGIVESIHGAWLTVSLRWEVFFHFLHNHYKFFRNSVSILLFTVAVLHVWALQVGFPAPHLLVSSPQGLRAAGLWSFKFLRFGPSGVQRFTAGRFQVFTGVHLLLGSPQSVACFLFTLQSATEFLILVHAIALGKMIGHQEPVDPDP